MAHIIIPNTTPAVVYAVGATPQSGFGVPFPYFAAADLQVYVGGVPAVLAATPVGAGEYNVNGIAVDGGFQSGTVNLGDAVSNTTVVIERRMAPQRVTDFPYPSPTLNIEALNTELDRAFALLQQAARDFGRALVLPVTETTGGALADALTRASKFLAFDASGALTYVASQPTGPGAAEAYWWGGTASGTGNAQAITIAGAPVAYQDGQRFIFLAAAANTGPTTLSVNSLGSKPINKGGGGDALAAGDIPSPGAVVSVVYDAAGGGRFRLLNVPSSAAAPDLSAYARKDQPNSFTEPQTVVKAAAGTLLEVRSTDAGATAAGLLLHRLSATPAADDELMDITIAGRDDAAAFRSFAILRGYLRNPAAATAEGELAAMVRLAGSLTTALKLRNGVVIGGATGGFTGTGTVNATGYYVDGVALSAARVYRSGAPQSFTNGATVTWLHGLGGAPDGLSVEFVLTTPTAGYPLGAVLPGAQGTDYDPVASLHGGLGLRTSATEIAVMVSTNGYAIVGPGGRAVITSGNAQVQVKAWRFA